MPRMRTRVAASRSIGEAAGPRRCRAARWAATRRPMSSRASKARDALRIAYICSGRKAARAAAVPTTMVAHQGRPVASCAACSRLADCSARPRMKR